MKSVFPTSPTPKHNLLLRRLEKRFEANVLAGLRRREVGPDVWFESGGLLQRVVNVWPVLCQPGVSN